MCALAASKDYDNGHYKDQPEIGQRAFARVYSAWAYGQTVRLLYSLSLSSLPRLSFSPL